MMKIAMAPPGREDELSLARRRLTGDTPEGLLDGGHVVAVLAEGELAAARAGLAAVTVREELLGYLVDVVRATRAHAGVLTGAGPRATQALLDATRVGAALRGRDFATPDDVKAMAGPVLEHRLSLRPEYEIEGVTEAETVAAILAQVPVPR